MGEQGEYHRCSLGCDSLCAFLSHQHPLLGPGVLEQSQRALRASSDGGRSWGTPALLLTFLFVWHSLNMWVVEAGEGIWRAKGGQVRFAARSQQTSILEALTMEKRRTVSGLIFSVLLTWGGHVSDPLFLRAKRATGS